MLDDQPTHQAVPTPSDTSEFLAESAAPASVLDEIREAEFPVARRGYDPGVVDAYIARVALVVEDLLATRSPNVAVNRALEGLGEQTAGIVREAQETARQMTERSQTQARERLEDADREAARVREEAEINVRRLDEDADRIWEERQRLIEDARRLAESLLKLADDAHERFPTEPVRTPVEAPSAPPLSASVSVSDTPPAPVSPSGEEVPSPKPARTGWAHDDENGALRELHVSVPEFTGQGIGQKPSPFR
jgi:DivIVA domain-containing protein